MSSQVCLQFYSLTLLHTHPLIYMDIKTPKRTHLLQNLCHFHNHRSQCRYHNHWERWTLGPQLSLTLQWCRWWQPLAMSISIPLQSKGALVFHRIHASHFHHLLLEYLVREHVPSSKSFFWKFASLVYWTRLLRHGGSADKSMFEFKLIVSFLHLSFNM